ncbi:MAG: shikimate kinase [Balneolaceae bacterium]|nr:shikimate kinase [Balneolaceae bacterium]
MSNIGNLPDRLFLCGFMGTGKSTIGAALARRLECPFADLDTIIEEETGQSIPEIFEHQGEEKFRTLEKKCLLQTVRTFKGVLALGGGALHNQHVVDHLKVNGLLIFVETSFSVILNRILKHEDRPLLLDKDGTMKEKSILEKELKELYEQRLPYYRQAEITIETGTGAGIEATTEKLVKKIRNHVAYH